MMPIGTGPARQPTAMHPAIQRSLAAIPRKWLYVGGGFIGLLVLIAMWPGGDDDEDSGDGDDGVVVGAGDDGGKAGGDGDEAEPDTKKPGVDPDTLLAIDQALTSKNDDAALDLIRPARDKFPNDPQLLWREGKALALQRAKSSKVTALERYGQALDQNPDLIEDPDFYAELNALLRNSTVQEQAINLALQKLGPSGHKFLLELVNVDDPKKVLDWVDRHRVLTELNSSEESQKLVDWQLNLARDLYQAPKAPKPCIAFRDTLDAISKAEDVYFVEHIFNSKLTPPEFTSGDAEDGEVCGGLEAKLGIVRAQLSVAYPEEAAKYSEGTKKSGGSSKKKKK
ncbi:MAG: hypothetical protein KC431_15915, partial [Myxococcales bacterium]|nr:hypothetical protein [Myxococcales bacterium]